MKQLKLDLINEEDKKALLLENDYILVPLKGENNYHEQTPVKESILDVYLSMQPTIVCIREQSYNSGEIWWPHHWTDVIKALVGSRLDSLAYITDWNIGKDTVQHFVPNDYDGRIIKRGNRVPLLLELTKALIQSDDMCDIWNYGTSGYIFPKNWEQRFIGYTQRNIYSINQIKNFYENMTFTFWMGGEIDIMYLLCHKYEMSTVEEILSKANSIYFYL